MDAGELKRALAAKAPEVAAYLLPNGRREGAAWRVGSVAGEAGRSLAVELRGPRAGVWADFAGDGSGDLIDLWCAVRRVPLAEALAQIRDWLGVARPQLHRAVPERPWRRPPKPAARPAQGRVRDYLVEARNIPAEILTRYRVGEFAGAILFPFLLPDGTLAMAKTRAPEDGAKPKPTAAECEPVLFGWQAIPPDARSAVIVEGEIDALSWAAYGYPALSVPYGGGGGAKQRWIECEFERLQRFERLYLALDMDAPGEAAAQAIAARLGRHRCWRVAMPRKDGNACLMDGVSQAAIDDAVAAAAPYDPDGLALPSSLTGAVTALFWPKPGDHVGYRMPYGKLRERLAFRPAELTIWTGEAGSGKSQLLSDCAVDWVAQGARVCLSSLEMQPAQTLKRMVKQVVGTDRPTAPAIAAALEWLDRGLILYTLTGKARIDALLEVFDYCRAKYGCDQFVIDSLMRLGIAGDDYTGQEGAIFRLVDWTIRHGVHTHLVAHARKADKARGVPATEDIKGAMEIGANAFNILTVWRNRAQEETARAGGGAGADDDRPPVILNVAKQRNGDFEGKIGLWFDQESYQYASSYDSRRFPRRYLGEGWEEGGGEGGADAAGAA